MKNKQYYMEREAYLTAELQRVKAKLTLVQSQRDQFAGRIEELRKCVSYINQFAAQDNSDLEPIE